MSREVKHPVSYATVPLGAMHVMVVDVGTVITDERSSETATIDDHTIATKGTVIYCTEQTYNALKQAYSQRTP